MCTPPQACLILFLFSYFPSLPSPSPPLPIASPLFCCSEYSCVITVPSCMSSLPLPPPPPPQADPALDPGASSSAGGKKKKGGAPKAKGAVRAKSGCYTCRIRRKVCLTRLFHSFLCANTCFLAFFLVFFFRFLYPASCACSCIFLALSKRPSRSL